MSEPAFDSDAVLRLGEAIERARAEERAYRDATVSRQLERDAALADLLRGRSSSSRLPPSAQ